MLYASRVPHERLGDAHRLALEGAGLDPGVPTRVAAYPYLASAFSHYCVFI